MQRYLETRTITSSSSTVGVDLARHMLARQHLGKTIVICDKPVILMSVVRKYWLKLARSLQKERSSTLNAEKILQLTHDITHMQHMDFVARAYSDCPHADVFFLKPNQLDLLPPGCFSAYVLADLTNSQLDYAVAQLPQRSLVVDYSHSVSLQTCAQLSPKHQLEIDLQREWQKVTIFFAKHGVELDSVSDRLPYTLVDELLDRMFDDSNTFLRTSNDFLELLRLAQPTNTPSTTKQLYDLVATLNRRMYALTPGILSQQFIQTLNDDSPSMHDSATERLELLLMV